MELNDYPDNASVSIREANSHIVDEGITHTQKIEKKRISQSHRNAIFPSIPTILTKVSQFLISMK